MNAFPNITQVRLKSFQKLTQKKYREEEQKFLIEGIHLVEEVLQSEWKIETLLICPAINNKVNSIERRAKSQGVEVYEVSERELDKLTDTVTSQGIVGVVAERTVSWDNLFNKLPKKSVIIALEDVADPGNVGTILRTCDWFNVQGILLNKNSVELYSPKVVRASMGAIFHIPIIDDVDFQTALATAKKFGFKVIATVLEGGSMLQTYEFPEKSVIVFGNEARGVSASIKRETDDLLTIPKFGKAESLNVAIACGVVLGSLRI